MTPSLSTIPYHIFTNIIEYTCHYENDEFDFDSWFKTRLVNRIFKETVEAFFVSHYLKYMGLYFDFGKRDAKDDQTVQLTGSFLFERLDEKDPRRAICVTPGVSENFWEIFKESTQNAVNESSNEDTDLIMQIRRRVKDVPPQDLDFRGSNESGDFSVSFNWWRTMTIWMADERAMSDLSDLKNMLDQLKDQIAKGTINADQAMTSGFDQFRDNQNNKLVHVRRSRMKRLARCNNPEIKFTDKQLEEVSTDREEEMLEKVKQTNMLVQFHECSDESASEEEDDDWEDDEDVDEEESSDEA